MYQSLKLPPSSEKPVKLSNITGLRSPLNCVVGNLGVPTTGSIFAVDPGVNFGITIITPDSKVNILWGTLDKHPSHAEHGLMAENLIIQLVKRYKAEKAKFVLEGAAFNKAFGQVGLAEVRQGFYAGMRKFTEEFSVVPPMTARKVVFGNGRTQAGDIWPLLNHNAADSLGLAYYGLYTM